MTDIKERVFSVMADIFEINISEITENTSPDNLENWDSMKQMYLLAALEEEFNLRLTDNEMADCINADAIIQIFQHK
jgi:acyl carrier protein